MAVRNGMRQQRPPHASRKKAASIAAQRDQQAILAQGQKLKGWPIDDVPAQHGTIGEKLDAIRPCAIDKPAAGTSLNELRTRARAISVRKLNSRPEYSAP